MRKFLINTVGFIFFLFAALFVTDSVCSKQLRNKGTLPYAVWNDIIEDKADANVLILGSSRAWSSYSPMVLDSILGCKSYNLGIDGSAFNRQLMRYEVWCHYYSKPELIIQNIDYFSTLDWTTGYMDYQFFPFFSNRTIRDKAFASESFSFGQKYLPMYRYMSFGMQKLFYTEEYPMIRGYYGVEDEWNGDNYRAIKTVKFSYDIRTLRLFSESLRIAREEGIRVVLVFAPIYTGVTTKLVNMDEMYDLFNHLSQEYDAPILDFTFDTMCSDTTLFYNATHLNKKGSELFCQKLAHAIDSLSVL